jgi:hypothetical protein
MTAAEAPAKMQTVPNQPKTPVRGVRLPPHLWTLVQREAAAREVNASDVMRDAIAEHFGVEVSPDEQ